jgi:hypothetical protein
MSLWHALAHHADGARLARSRSSRSNSSADTKKGFSCSIPPMMAAGWVRRTSMMEVTPNLA